MRRPQAAASTERVRRQALGWRWWMLQGARRRREVIAHARISG